MKKLAFFFTLCTLHFTHLQAQDNVYNLIPFPAQFNGGEGQFVVNAQTKIIVTAKDAALKPIAQSLINTLKTASKLTLPIAVTVAPTAKNVIYIRQNKALGLGTEGYKLIVSADRVILETATPQGAFYGMQTIFQLLPPAVFSPVPVENTTWAMPVCQIQDKPRFVHRGLMLDVSRHFMPVAFVKKYIDLLALHKMNVFHWHLTDDQGWRIEIKKYPKLFIYTFIAVYIVVEASFLIALLEKFPKGGYITLLIALFLAGIMACWYIAKLIRQRYTDVVPLNTYTQMLCDLSVDPSIQKYATHLVYMTSANNPSLIESKIVYSILQKRPKKADIYWFVHVDRTNDPYAREYDVEELSNDLVIKVNIRLGFRVQPRVHNFFNFIVKLN